jgi:hypothetical protein
MAGARPSPANDQTPTFDSLSLPLRQPGDDGPSPSSRSTDTATPKAEPTETASSSSSLPNTLPPRFLLLSSDPLFDPTLSPVNTILPSRETFSSLCRSICWSPSGCEDVDGETGGNPAVLSDPRGRDSGAERARGVLQGVAGTYVGRNCVFYLSLTRAVQRDALKLTYSSPSFQQDLIKRARRRLYISSLYIGVEQDELVRSPTSLLLSLGAIAQSSIPFSSRFPSQIAALRSALAAQPQLRVTFILDYHRCTREPYPRPSTASVLSALVRDHPGRVEAWFFRSPKLKGLMELLVPRRFDEGFGTWHSKVYAGDEEVIISG